MDTHWHCFSILPHQTTMRVCPTEKANDAHDQADDIEPVDRPSQNNEGSNELLLSTHFSDIIGALNPRKVNAVNDDEETRTNSAQKCVEISQSGGPENVESIISRWRDNCEGPPPTNTEKKDVDILEEDVDTVFHDQDLFKQSGLLYFHRYLVIDTLYALGLALFPRCTNKSFALARQILK